MKEAVYGGNREIMKVKMKIVNKLFTLVLIMLLCVNCFAAAVSDNDGSAFITKAEFDSLKNNFQAQLDQYNSSIDQKIDVAIAAYIAGITVSRKKTLNLHLSNQGKYGNYILKWNSSTTRVWDNKDTKKANLVYDISDFDFDYAKDLSSKPWSDNTLYYTGYLRGRGEHVGESSLDDLKYITSKKVKFKYSDGSQSYVYERKKMYSSIYLNMTQWTPYRNAATVTYWNMGGPGSVLNENYTNMKQDVTNLYVDYFNIGKGTRDWKNEPIWAYAFTGWVTLASTELDSDWDYELICPNSTANDYYWDPEDKTSYVRLGDVWDTDLDTRYTSPLRSIGSSTSAYYLHTDIDSVDFHPRARKQIYVPWCEKNIVHNQMELQTLKNVNENNKKVKNGVILYEISEKGKVTMSLNADNVGTAEFYISKNPTDTWPSTSVISKSITETDTDIKITFEEFKTEDFGKYIWMRYLPTDTTLDAVLKITDAYIESDE